MKPSRFFQKVNLHDSLITEINYSPDKHECIFKIELCNWMQTSYKEDEAEVIFGNLIFNGITLIEFNPNLNLFSDSENIDAQILETQNISKSDEPLETWKFTMIVSNYDDKDDKILVVTSKFRDIEWIIS